MSSLNVSALRSQLAALDAQLGITLEPRPRPRPGATCPGCEGDGACHCDDCPGAGHESCEWCHGEAA